MNKLIDALGVPLSEHTRWLPDRVALWPIPPKIVDKEAAIRWKTEKVLYSFQRCWFCERRAECNVEIVEVHHMCRISHHDAYWNFALLCSDCHRHDGDAVKAESLYRLLTLKHKYDRQSCSWVHLALGMGRRLPTGDNA